MEKLKVGQRIELYQILTNGGYNGNAFISGTIRPGIAFGHELIDVLANNSGPWDLLSMELYTEIRPIGAMIIKKLKKPFKVYSAPITVIDRKIQIDDGPEY